MRGCSPRPSVDRPNSFARVVETWDQLDKEPQPEGPLLLYGSSIMRRWPHFSGHWKPLPAMNRAFGGSRTWEAIQHFERGVAKYRPRVILFYCGSNDVNFHVTRCTQETAAVTEVLSNVTVIIDAASCIGAHIVVGSVIKAPQKRLHNAAVQMIDRINAGIMAVCSAAHSAEFVDLNPCLENADGTPIESLYLEDKLHYLPAAYQRMRNALKDAVWRRWAQSEKPSTLSVAFGDGRPVSKL